MINKKETISTMRTLFATALCALALVAAACTDSPTATSNAKLGKTTVEEMMTNTAYRSWYEPGYSAYPDASAKAIFDSSVAVIKGAFDPTVHTVVMAVKPNCGCQTTQLWMPRVMKALDEAGIPHENVQIYITDSRLNGIDDIKTKFNLKIAPVFMVLKNETVTASIDPTVLASNRTIEQELASGFAQP